MKDKKTKLFSFWMPVNLKERLNKYRKELKDTPPITFIITTAIDQFLTKRGF